MKALIKLVKKTYFDILQSIAFYPILISIAFLVLAITGLQAEHWEVIVAIKKKLPYLFIQDYETARSILSTLVGGILSLTVFSFSMVMVVLSQASSNFSPRLLPSLISNKKNQIILGVYVGTLLYCIVILISLGAYGIDSNSLGLSTMFAAILGVICVAFFVYFIHSISRAIQIHNIIHRIYKRCKNYLEHELSEQLNFKLGSATSDSKDWTTLKSKHTGYYRDFDVDLLEGHIINQDIQILVLPYTNKHVWEGTPVLRVSLNLNEEEIENLLFCLTISSDRHEDDRGVGGMIKLMEIAVKAMSPGINDPGTAIDAINKIGELLAKFLQFPSFTAKTMAKGKCQITRTTIPAEELMRIIVQPIRLYARHDSAVLYELIEMLKFIRQTSKLSHQNRNVVELELEAIRCDLEKNITNPIDKKQILKLYSNLSIK